MFSSCLGSGCLTLYLLSAAPRGGGGGGGGARPHQGHGGTTLPLVASRGFYPDNTRHRRFYCSLFCRSACCSADDWSWVTARRQKKKRKVLAGFARAIGDGALVATVHDIIVLPELQGLGLGRKLLAKITSQVYTCCHNMSVVHVLLGYCAQAVGQHRYEFKLLQTIH